MLFEEMATLVSAEGAMGDRLNNVETNLQLSENYFEKAEKHLESAEVIHKSNKKATCCMMVCMVVVMLILVIMLSGLIPI